MAKKQSKILVTALPLKSMQIANFRDAARQERKKAKASLLKHDEDSASTFNWEYRKKATRSIIAFFG